MRKNIFASNFQTDFLGDDVGDGKGISTGSAIACKQACQANNRCKFWSFRDGWARDCYLKRGRRGDPNPTGAIPKIGFISGTKGNAYWGYISAAGIFSRQMARVSISGNDDCLCLPNGANTDEEICPLKSSRPVFPWKNVDGVGRTKDKNDKDRPFRCGLFSILSKYSFQKWTINIISGSITTTTNWGWRWMAWTASPWSLRPLERTVRTFKTTTTKTSAGSRPNSTAQHQQSNNLLRNARNARMRAYAVFLSRARKITELPNGFSRRDLPFVFVFSKLRRDRVNIPRIPP